MTEHNKDIQSSQFYNNMYFELKPEGLGGCLVDKRQTNNHVFITGCPGDGERFIFPLGQVPVIKELIQT